MPRSSHLIDILPEHLAERAHALNEKLPNESGEFVLCWLHHAIRDHENAALDAAVMLGNHLGKPVLVYQGLGGNHRYNADRHHVFIMEGARDLQAALVKHGIAYAFHLPSDPSEPSPLRGLIERACAFITEDFPAPPFKSWTAAHAKRCGCLAAAVDSACLMPMRMLDKRFERAFKFRDKAKKEWKKRIARPWEDAEPTVEPFGVTRDSVGFEPIDLQLADLEALATGCEIDHTTPPVRRIAGGSKAGYQRWEAFKQRGLSRYDKRRNNAADMEGVSCLSPYFHHGHVSPLAVAREADQAGGPGAEKFLDELLVWREMAYNFCIHTPDDALNSLRAIPGWARESLKKHEKDEREAVFSWETLARGRTEDELWDVAQDSLTINGELHNNMRMTWGKMIPGWTRTADEALHLLLDLNHRFALDGNNPSSYGGLLWCLGQFDRPFDDEPVIGELRPRTTAIHADRLKPSKYRASVRDRVGAEPLRVAVVGGGIAGLACARALHDQLCDVTVYDRGRAPTGRMSTRRVTLDDGSEITFDHGAPYFEVADPRLGRYARSWIQDGVAAAWKPTGRDDTHPLIVGAPTMSAIPEHLAVDLQVRRSMTVTTADWSGSSWTLGLESHDGVQLDPPQSFDALVLAMTPVQAARLVEGVVDPKTRMDPVWVAMVLTDATEGPDLRTFDDHPILDHAVRDSAKPGRAVPDGRETWVVHAKSGWSAERLDTDRDDIAAEIASAFTETTDAGVHLAKGHRWSQCRRTERSIERCAIDTDRKLVICGDGFGGTGVESAFLSAGAAAGRVLSWRPNRVLRG
ncbi:MAG: NAD(P)-binding protein [Planctomycetota bacterium]